MNVIQWMYKKEQVRTTLSKIIQWLSVLVVGSDLLAASFEKPFYHNQLTSPKTFDGFPFCFQL